ncbi:transposase [Streptomyces sp. NPDC007095]|uniref:transposase n=1 Tax=Streptomyces sp. NPDC007095 TaxID=3154482 RepID=UPI000CB89558
MHSSWLNWAFTNESYAVAHPLFRERYSPVEVRPGQTPAHSQPLIANTTTRDTIAKDLGIHKEALRGWVRQAEADHGERDDRLTTAERDELKQLRKENAELKRANEILKAASVFFAQEIDRPRTRPSR